MVWSSGGSPFDLTHRCEPRVDRLTPRRHHPVDVVPYLALISAVAALGLAFFYYKAVEKESPGNERMVFLMTEIQKGARAFLQAEYKWVSIFAIAMAILLAVVIAPLAAVTYILGAVLSAAAGYAGMTVATMANARTTEAAKEGPGKALPIAFRGGAVMGFSVAGLALLGLMSTYIVFVVLLEVDQAFEIVTAYGLGASTIALFSRVGGGIYTKAADVGADLVGKVEAGIPEDDPRNPATIADNVGDNVGDVAGMGADLFESYAGSIIAPISLVAFAAASLPSSRADAAFCRSRFPDVRRLHRHDRLDHRLVPRQGRRLDRLQALSKALHLGTNVAMGITSGRRRCGSLLDLGGDEFPRQAVGLAVSVIGGLIVGWALGKTAEYYTSDHFSPVKKIARQTETGPATTVLKGISTGMVSVAALGALILIGVGVAYWGGQQAWVTRAIGGSTASPSPQSACSRPRASSCPSMPTVRSLTTPAVSPRWPSSTRRSVKSPTHSTHSATPRPPSPRASLWARQRSPHSRCSRASSSPSPPHRWRTEPPIEHRRGRRVHRPASSAPICPSCSPPSPSTPSVGPPAR